MANRNTTLALLLALSACSRSTNTRDGGSGTAGRIERADDPIPSQYLVVLKPGTEPVTTIAANLIGATGAWTLRSYDRAMRGFAMHASEATAVAVSRDSRVAWVAEDGRVKAQALDVQAGAPAGLDRIDQRMGTDGSFGYHDAAGEKIHAYVLDTGVLASHTEFLGRPPDQIDFVRDGEVGDCNGHGTHVAGILGGSTYGVAKKVTLHSLRVLGCDASGSTSDLIAALDWLVGNAQTPAVANLSLGRRGDAALDAAVEAVVAAGTPVVVAAGDARRDACSTSPARAPGALTVGSTDLAGAAAASFSNHGPCVDLFAPGVDVRSASTARSAASLTFSGSVLASGTSTSAPFVAGAVALYLGRYTGASPAGVATALIGNSTRGPATILAWAPSGLPTPLRYTPDRFLFTTFIDDDNSADVEDPTATIDSPIAGVTVSGETIPVTASAGDDVGVTRVELFANGRFIGSSVESPHAFTWDTTRELNGSSTLVVRAYDGAGNATDSAPVTVSVSNVGVAHFDAVLGVPKCETVASFCDSTDLLEGRGELGPEEHAPNTLAYACESGADASVPCACADGSFGQYQLDESIERVSVRTTSNGALAVGENVEVTVEAVIGSTANDAVDVFAAASVVDPKWRHLGTLGANASGRQTLTAIFTLPVGEIQAVRAALRYGGLPSICTDGGFDERDDLAFVVGSGTPDTTPPTGVSITAPKAGSRFGGTIEVTAEALDEHIVSRVDFTAGSFLIGTDYAPPYAVMWRTGLLPDGMYDLRATAYDGAGNATASAPVSVEVKDALAPTVSIESPKTGDQIPTTPIVVKVVAMDEGIVKKVTLMVDGVVFAASTTPTDPVTGTYEFTWGNVPRPEPYLLVAVAEDGGTNSTSSLAVSIGVGDAIRPTCRIKDPIDLAKVVGNVFLEAEALDDTEVKQVTFHQVNAAGDILLGTATSAPFAALWESGTLLNGDYGFYCIATDTTGNESADHRLITLSANDTKDPSVDIEAPAVTRDAITGLIVPTPVTGEVLVRAGAADDGAVQMVEFYLDDSTSAFGYDNKAPYEHSWNSGLVPRAVHKLRAKAYDFNGHFKLSAPLEIDTRDLTPPTVAIAYPLANAVLDGVVPVRTQIGDTGGAIVKVELLDGTLLVQTLTAAPYEFNWSTANVPAGEHTLYVKATDVGGGEATASVLVKVEPTGAVFDPVLGAPACAGEEIRCHSSALLDGRDMLGPEPQAPNTLGSCFDGSLGSYHVDESIDFISVGSVVTTAKLAAGAEARVQVKAWIFDPAQDRVELFYAADARNPVWIALPTPVLQGSGAQTVTATYTLPNGDLQAIRASVRYAPTETGACVSGDFDDTDDLVFAVATTPDSAPPTVSIDSPTGAQEISGLVTIAATANDASGIAYVEFLVDGDVKGTDYAPPYTWSWDTAGFAGGTFTLAARAVDYAGKSQLSALVTVTVTGRVRVTSPLDGESVQGAVILAAEAFDHDGVDHVEFFIGADKVAAVTTAPYSVAWNSASVGDGEKALVARVYDAVGNFTDSPPVPILVSNVGNASWDNGFKAPACAAAATKCFTGTLVDGRGALGPEPRAPNTIGTACADGAQGSYHVDESIDAITIRSSQTFTAGATVVVGVKLWATQAYLMDSLDIYYAANASAPSPVWEHMATVKPAQAGAQVLSASFPLVAGGTKQAVRAQLRYGGEAAFVCGAGTFDDRDDVVFTVAP